MKKWWSTLCTIIVLLMGTGVAFAQPEPVYLVEMNRKPGIDFRQFKSVGNDISVRLRENSSWAIDRKGDPFLKQRIQDISLQAAKNQGWVLTDNENADMRLSVKILEWGRLKNVNDSNLMEYVRFELSAYTCEGLIFRGKGYYKRVDPEESDLEKLNDAYRMMLEEFLVAMHLN